MDGGDAGILQQSGQGFGCGALPVRKQNRHVVDQLVGNQFIGVEQTLEVIARDAQGDRVLGCAYRRRAWQTIVSPKQAGG